MDTDDPRLPLLGIRRSPSRARRAVSRICGAESWRRRLPITSWLPQYSWDYLIRDSIAGITVGLTSIPQGIAYAMVAGLPPQVGLYSSIFPGLVYMLMGSVKDVTVGPTAILAALLAKYVAVSPDFAYLAAFLSGCIIMLLGILQLGFLLDFISKPVIGGFTTAAALQIGASQLKGLFRISGSSGGTFIGAIINFIKNIKTVHLWDTLLGVVSIGLLVALKKSSVKPIPGYTARAVLSRCWICCVRARNALVVLATALLAFGLAGRGEVPFALTGKIEGGLPHFGLPPFSTKVGNRTLNFGEMLETFGAEGLVMPLVAILESIAIAKAFAGSTPVDATQEMLAVGAGNIVAACAQAMPATGSFTRTALNHACAVATPAGSFFKATLVLLSVTLLSDAFYYIPRATLAAIIMVAMVSIIDLDIVRCLWRNSKLEFLVYTVTVVVGATCGLEYGILAGAAGDALRVLASTARPPVSGSVVKVGNVDVVMVALPGALWYGGAGGAARALGALGRARRALVLRGDRLTGMDVGVAESLLSAISSLEKERCRVLLWNFPEHSRRLLEDLDPAGGGRFVDGPSIDQHILGLDIDTREPITNHRH